MSAKQNAVTTKQILDSARNLLRQGGHGPIRYRGSTLVFQHQGEEVVVSVAELFEYAKLLHDDRVVRRLIRSGGRTVREPLHRRSPGAVALQGA